MSTVESNGKLFDNSQLLKNPPVTCQSPKLNGNDFILIVTLGSPVTKTILELMYEADILHECSEDDYILAYVHETDGLTCQSGQRFKYPCTKESTYAQGLTQACRIYCTRMDSFTKIYIRLASSLTGLKICNAHTCPDS